MRETSGIVLVKPPEQSAFNFGTYSLGVLAAYVRDLSAVEIVDATVAEPGDAAVGILARRPRVVGVTVMGLDSVAPAARFLSLLRRSRKRPPGGASRALLVAGGHGASMLPAVLLDAGADAVVIGEGERTFRGLLEEGLRPGAAGVACKVDGRLVLGPRQRLLYPLDRLPPPARDLMAPPADGVHLMETSRGCPHACAFCEATRFYGRRWRPFSAARVAAEVRRLVHDHEAWIIHFADDNFAASPRRVLDICAALQGESLPAFFMVSARADDLLADPDLLPAMAASRILRISVGVESLDAATASGVGKPIGPAVYRRLFRRMRELGMFSVASFIVGLPGERPEVRARSLELAVEAAPDSAQFLPFLPLPGTPLAPAGSGRPAEEDARAARELTREFFRHPQVWRRLEAAREGDGVKAILASGALRQYATLREPRG